MVDANGTVTYANGSNGSIRTFLPLTNGEPLAIDATGNISCVTALIWPPNAVDVVDCRYGGNAFTIALPAGSQPTAVKVLPGFAGIVGGSAPVPPMVIVFGRGDRTVRFFSVTNYSGGTTVTAGDTFVLQDFTATDATYWNEHPVTGGWDMVLTSTGLAIMGQLVNSDGSVSQKLALVNGTTKAIQYVDLPAGTIHIATDLANNAVAAEYPDFSGTSPVMRFVRVYADTGNVVQLQSVSSLVPGAGFLVTKDGNNIAVFSGGQADFQPNN